MNLLDHLQFWFGSKAKNLHQELDPLTEEETARVLHYIKLSEPFSITHSSPVNAISIFKKTGYAYDWYRIFDNSDKRLCKVIFGDVAYIADEPSFCKSRPIAKGNMNNVLLPLNTVRHLNFIDDRLTFQQKSDQAVWRGAAYKPKRKAFLDSTKKSRLCDTADTSRHSGKSLIGRSVNYMSIKEQLKFKFIFAIEGNDVATNLKWAMSSKSVVVMPQPTQETWFCESQLEANRHYIEIRPDYADLEDKLEYFLCHPNEATEIVAEANRFCEPYRNLRRQFQIARWVAHEYFSLVIDD